MLKYEVLQVGPLEVNCTIVYNDKKGLVFDAGGSFSKIYNFLSTNGIGEILLINTHGHFDHIGAIAELKRSFKADFYMDSRDEFLLKQASFHSGLFGLGAVEVPDIDIKLDDIKKIDNDITEINIIHTPGHTPGGLCFYLPELEILISGDTLFNGSIGRTDFPYGNFDDLKRSVKLLYELPDDTIVITGHGEFTTIGDEKRYNPYVTFY